MAYEFAEQFLGGFQRERLAKRQAAKEKEQSLIAGEERQAKRTQEAFERRKDVGFEGATDPGEMIFRQRLQKRQDAEDRLRRAQARYYEARYTGGPAGRSRVPALKALLSRIDASGDTSPEMLEARYRTEMELAEAGEVDIALPRPKESEAFPAAGVLGGAAAGGAMGLRFGGLLGGAVGAAGGAGMGAFAERMARRGASGGQLASGGTVILRDPKTGRTQSMKNSPEVQARVRQGLLQVVSGP